MTTRRLELLHVAVLVAALASLGALAACVQHQATGAPSVGTIITEAEIDSVHLSTAYDVIHKLRPQFLADRGKMTLHPNDPPVQVRVYVDNQFYGDVSTLRGILTGTIESIRYYSGSEAQYKYGANNAAGVIAIFTKH